MGVPFVVGRFSLATSGATQDFELGGETRTPVAAYFYTIGATADATSTSQHIQCWGAADGTSEWYGTIRSDDNEPLSDCSTDHDTDAVIVVLDSLGAVDGQLSFNSFIPGGVRLTHDNNPSTAWFVIIWFFFEGSYQVGTVTTGATAGVPTDVSVSGFVPSFVIPAEFGSTAFGSGVQADCRASIGFVADNEASGALQATACYFERDAVNTTENAAITDNGHGSGWIDRFGTGGGEHFTTYAFTTGGFSATPANQNTAHNIGYLCGLIEGMDVWAGHLSTSAGGTGSFSFAEPQIEGSYGLLALTALLNESHAVGAAAEAFGWGCYTQAAQFSGCGSSDDNRSTAVNMTLTRSFTSTNLIDVQAPPGATFYSAAWTASTSTGFTVNITTGNASARLLPALIFAPFPDTVAVDETLGLVEESSPLGLVVVEETLGLLEEVLAHTGQAVDETLGLLEDPQLLTSQAIDEVLGIFEEVDEFSVFAPDPTGPRGEGGFARVEEGEGGQAGVVIGSG